MTMPIHYQYADLRHINRWLWWLLLPPVLLTVAGLLHALYSFALLTGLAPELPLEVLSSGLRRTLAHDDAIRFTQIALTLLFILFFCVCWLFFAFRNVAALAGGQVRSHRNSLAIHFRIWGNLIFALRLMQRLWRESTPDSHAHLAERWLLPWWWLTLIAANTCKVLAILALRQPRLIGEWREGLLWMLAAYGFYFLLFMFTWRLVKRLEMLQRASWQHITNPRQPVLKTV